MRMYAQASEIYDAISPYRVLDRDLLGYGPRALSSILSLHGKIFSEKNFVPLPEKHTVAHGFAVVHSSLKLALPSCLHLPLQACFLCSKEDSIHPLQLWVASVWGEVMRYLHIAY